MREREKYERKKIRERNDRGRERKRKRKMDGERTETEKGYIVFSIWFTILWFSFWFSFWFRFLWFSFLWFSLLFGSVFFGSVFFGSVFSLVQFSPWFSFLFGSVFLEPAKDTSLALKTEEQGNHSGVAKGEGIILAWTLYEEVTMGCLCIARKWSDFKRSSCPLVYHEAQIGILKYRSL